MTEETERVALAIGQARSRDEADAMTLAEALEDYAIKRGKFPNTAKTMAAEMIEAASRAAIASLPEHTQLLARVAELETAVSDGIATLLAVRATAVDPDAWEQSRDHFYSLCRETIKGMNAALRADQPADEGLTESPAAAQPGE